MGDPHTPAQARQRKLAESLLHRATQPGAHRYFGEDVRALAAELSAAHAKEATLREALECGRRFERFYQETLGATPTATQYEILDRLHTQFYDAHTEALAGDRETFAASGDTPEEPR